MMDSGDWINSVFRGYIVLLSQYNYLNEVTPKDMGKLTNTKA